MRHIWLPICIGLGILVSGCKNDESLQSVITQEVASNAESYGISASSVVVVKNGKQLYKGHHGVMAVNSTEKISDTSIFPIYSVAKLFASTLTMQLADQGKLRLTDPVSQHVAGLPNEWLHITISQLLNHASGLPEFYEVKNGRFIGPETLQEAINDAQNKPVMFEPNTQTQYNQTNYLLTRMLIEQMYQQRYEQVVKEQILLPLGLENTFLDLNHVPKERLVAAYQPNSGKTFKTSEFYFPLYGSSAGSIYSSAEDLSLFITALAKGELMSQGKLLSFWQPHQLVDDESDFASGWVIDNAGNWQHVGHDGGASLRVRLLYRDNLDEFFVVVYLTNGNKSGVWSSTLTNSVQQHILPDYYSRIATWFY